MTERQFHPRTITTPLNVVSTTKISESIRRLHDGPLYKEVMDGDNKPIRIEICRHYRVENDSYSFIDKVLQAAPDADHTFHDFHQVNMFGDIENNDSIVGVTQPGNDYIYTTDFSSKDLTDTLTITTVDSGTVTIRDPQWEVSTTCFWRRLQCYQQDLEHILLKVCSVSHVAPNVPQR